MGLIDSVTLEINENGIVRDITPIVRKFMYKTSLLESSTIWILQLYAEKVNTEEDLIFLTKKIPIRLSYNREGNTQTTGWETFIPKFSEMVYQDSTPLVQLHGTGVLGELNDKKRWLSYRETTPTEIVSKIAVRHGLITQAAITTTTQTWLQIGETDYEFLKRLRLEVTSGIGQRHMWFYSAKNNLFFAPLNLAKPAVRSFGVGNSDDRVNNIKFSYNFREAEKLGGGDLYITGFDPLTKTELGGKVSQVELPALAGKHPRLLSNSKRHITTPFSSEVDIKRQGLVSWMDATTKLFSAHITLLGDITLNLGEIVEINAKDLDGSSSSFNGKYPIYEIVHSYSVASEKNSIAQPLKTNLGCFRQTCHKGFPAVGSNVSKMTSTDNYSLNAPINLQKTTKRVISL